MVTAACSVTGLVIGQSTYAQGDDLWGEWNSPKKLMPKKEEEKKDPKNKTSEVDTGNEFSSEVRNEGTNSLNYGKIVTGVLFFGFWLALTLLIIGVAIELNKKSVANVNSVLRIALKFGLWFASMFAIYLIGVIFYAIWGFLF
jgi:hypothetical protein